MALERKDEKQQDDPRSRKKLLLISLSSIIVLGILAAAGMHFTSQPNFCYSCHEIRPNVTSWSVGSHKGVPCLDCHANPGPIGYVSRKLAGIGEVYLHATNQIPAKIEARFNTETCIYCHTGKISGFPGAKNITLTSGDNAPKFPHTSFLSQNVSCLDCHRYVAHPQQVK